MYGDATRVPVLCLCSPLPCINCRPQAPLAGRMEGDAATHGQYHCCSDSYFLLKLNPPVLWLPVGTCGGSEGWDSHKVKYSFVWKRTKRLHEAQPTSLLVSDTPHGVC